MARKTVVELVDDLDGQVDGSVQTVRFGLQGTQYEIDLGPANQDKLRAALAPFIENGRARGNGSRAAARPGAGVDREQIQAIRDWGRNNGWDVNDRGRLGKDLVAAYHDAQ